MVSVLVVVESCFGNTMELAQLVAAALGGRDRVCVVGADTAPVLLPPEVDLLLVGAPTHAFTLPTPSSRAQAAHKGAAPAAETGVREWAARLAVRPGLRVVTFDTSVRLRLSPGCAAKAARRLLRRRGFTDVERGPSFFVTGTPGPLADGEGERATQWGRQLASGLALH